MHDMCRHVKAVVAIRRVSFVLRLPTLTPHLMKDSEPLKCTPFNKSHVLGIFEVHRANKVNSDLASFLDLG